MGRGGGREETRGVGRGRGSGGSVTFAMEEWGRERVGFGAVEGLRMGLGSE